MAWKDRGGAARIVTWLGAVLALTLVLQIVFKLAETNPGNGLVRFVNSAANVLAIFFRNLFVVDNNAWQVILNYGLPAIFWLIVAAVAARLLRG